MTFGFVADRIGFGFLRPSLGTDPCFSSFLLEVSLLPRSRTSSSACSLFAAVLLLGGSLACSVAPSNASPSGQTSLVTTAQGLAIAYAAGDSAASVTRDVGLPESLPNNVSVSWWSSTLALVSTTGSVTVPAAGTAEVTLKATLLQTNPAGTLTKTFKLLLASNLATSTGTDVVQAGGNVLQSTSGATSSECIVGDSIAAASSRSSHGAIVVQHGFQTPN